MAKRIALTVLMLFSMTASLTIAQQRALSKPGKMVPFSMDWQGFAEGEMDLSFLLDKPAGRAGHTMITDGHFATADGKRLRLWGVNVTGGACFPEKADAPRVAAFLARLGINAVRFHFLDSNWGQEKSLFDSDLQTTRQLESGQLDRLDYFVAALKTHGIYVNFNLNVGRTFRKEDGVPDYKRLGLAKGVTLFDDHIIELQKEYAKQLLTHVNPYTGRSYVNEPALILVEIVNENSLVEAWFSGRLLGEHDDESPSTWSDIPSSYARLLDRKYNEWLKTELSISELNDLKKEANITPSEALSRLKPEEFNRASRQRFHTEARFIMGLEQTFFMSMYRFLKEELKLHAHVAGNSDHNHYKSGYALLSSLAHLDVVDGHVYWQHPNYTRDPDTGKQKFTIKNTPMVNDPFHSTVVQLARSAVQGKPYTVSETNHPYPNEYACEGVGILGAYALLQDWDGLFFYTLEHDDPQQWQDKTPNYFDLYSDPVKIANMAAASLMFHRGDLASAQTVTLRNYSHDQLVEGLRGGRESMPMFTPGFSNAIPLVHQTRIHAFDQQDNTFPDLPLLDRVRSQTNEITWHHLDDQGLVVVDSSKTQSLIGHVGRPEAQSQNLIALVNNPFCAIALSSMDGQPIGQSNRLMLTTTARSGLSNMRWNAERTSLAEWGKKPTVIEPVTGHIVLRRMGSVQHARLVPFDGRGMAGKATQVTPNSQQNIVLDLTPHVTVWYIIDIDRH